MKRVLCCAGLLLGLLVSPVWAFPTNAVIENFTGVDDTTPPNGNWTNGRIHNGATANVRIRSNGATTVTNATLGGAYWSATTFSANEEVYGTLTIAGASTYSCVVLRMANIGTNTSDGYSVCAFNGSSAVNIERIDNGVTTQIGTTSQAVTSGDSVGLTAIGNQICSWFKDGAGAWTQLTCATDSTYPAGGYIGMMVQGSNTANLFDSFGGGNLPSGRPVPPILLQ